MDVDDALRRVLGAVGGDERAGQREMARAVADAMAQRHHLLVQAGTGTGKTYAYLVPALLHVAAGGGRVVVATATLALQRQLVARDLPTVRDALREVVPPVGTALLKGRGNYVCRLRLERSTAAEPASEALFEVPSRLEAQAAAVRRWAEVSATGDRDDLPEPVDARVWRAVSVTGRECVGRQRCPVGEACFAETARDAAAEAELVVTNHAMLAIDLADEARALPEYEVAIIDEAHDFSARLTSASTETLGRHGIEEALRLAGPLISASARDALAHAAEAYAEQVALELGARQQPLLPELSEPMVRSLAVLRDAAHAALSELAGTPDADIARRAAAEASLAAVHDTAGHLLSADPGTVRWGSSEPLGLTCAPLSVAGLIQGSLLPGRTVIATSATLKVGGSIAALAADWGMPGTPVAAGAGWRHLDVGSPFDYQRQAILYLPRDLPLPDTSPISDAALARIGALIRAAAGRALVLASSWRAVDAIDAYLRDAQIPGVELLVQERGSPPTALARAFAERPHSVLVGTISLWQGIDVPGPACSLVIIDKIPFPRPDEPLLAARGAAAAAAGRSAFASVALPHAGQLLAQGAGRLIRSATDRGVVAILDRRITSRSYGGYLLGSLPQMWRTSDTSVVLEALRRLAAS